MDRSFLAWPFIPADAAPVYDGADAWAGVKVSVLIDERDESMAAACDGVRALVAAMGRDGARRQGSGQVSPRTIRILRRLCFKRRIVAQFFGRGNNELRVKKKVTKEELMAQLPPRVDLSKEAV